MKEIAYEILEAINEIPEGKVATYSQIAKLIGRDKNARLVGKVCSQSKLYGNYPCHRVVNAQGRTAPFWDEQIHLLEQEGVFAKPNGAIDLKKYQWK